MRFWFFFPTETKRRFILVTSSLRVLVLLHSLLRQGRAEKKKSFLRGGTRYKRLLLAKSYPSRLVKSNPSPYLVCIYPLLGSHFVQLLTVDGLFDSSCKLARNNNGLVQCTMILIRPITNRNCRT